MVILHIPGVKNPADLFTRGGVEDSATALSQQQEDQHEWFTVLGTQSRMLTTTELRTTGKTGTAAAKSGRKPRVTPSGY